MVPPNLLSFPSSSTPPPPVRNPNPNLGFGVPSPARSLDLAASDVHADAPALRRGAPTPSPSEPGGSDAEAPPMGATRSGTLGGRRRGGGGRMSPLKSSTRTSTSISIPMRGFGIRFGSLRWDLYSDFLVFKAYGYLLPAIIASMLLATGPKAFLMALALPLGQSAVSLAIEKIWGKNREGPRTKPKTKKKPFARPTDNFFRRQRQDVSSSENNGKPSYHSWVSADNGSEGSKSSKPRFGGWDALDRQGNLNNGPVRTQSRTINGSGLSEEPVNKLSTKGRYRDAPLLLRLLIAVFPFLGSWTRIL
uniref:Uncharacterized protein n=1 Tax=Ananas comosus var. bracteatus TaxID=296719 RepID=A0A6V7PJ08_ANACO|nr:unnamed protein product [Ananas comosus var. bracteatus]